VAGLNGFALLTTPSITKKKKKKKKRIKRRKVGLLGFSLHFMLLNL
jgi:hypothetical protein